MEDYFRIFSYVDSLCESIGTRAYLWGGWIPDIYSGKTLREHDDSEYLIQNLYANFEKIQNAFIILGWQTKTLENGDLKVIKDKVKIHFGHLLIKDNIAEWYHNGKLGKIIFPRSWLNDSQISFYDANIHTVRPEFQLVLKLHPEFMNPEWKHRDKDKQDIKELKKFVKRRDIKSLEMQMKSISL